MMDKILKIIDAKDRVREKELLQMDYESEDQEKTIIKKTKQLEQTDKFFTLDGDVQDTRNPGKKLLVQRNGKVVDSETL